MGVHRGCHDQHRSTPNSRVVQIDEREHLFIAVSGQVNVHLRIDAELTATLPASRHRFTALSFWADDPGAARQAIQSQLVQR